MESTQKFDSPFEDLAHGCIIGAFLGDAIGATLEFIKYRPDHNEIMNALTVPGGGYWKVGPGQVTDDSELAMCLLQAIVKSNQNSKIP